MIGNLGYRLGLVCLLSSPQAAHAGDLLVFSLEIQGVTDPQSVNHTFVREFSSRGYSLLTLGEKDRPSSACLGYPPCIASLMAFHKAQGLLDVKVLRFGPRMIVTIKIYIPPDGKKIFEKKATIAFEELETSGDLGRLLEKCIEYLPKEPKTAEIRVQEPKPIPQSIEPSKEVNPLESALPTEHTPTDLLVLNESVPPPKGISSQKAWGWVLTGFGAAALATSAATGGWMLSLQDEVLTQCGNDGDHNDHTCPLSVEDDYQRVRALGLTTDILIGVGAASALTGVLLLVLVDDSDLRSDKSLSLKPTMGRDFAGVGLQGRF